MLKIYFLRHGKTLLNENEQVQGWNDSELTDLGKFQAKCAGFGAKDILFNKAYCGDLGRQISTAKLFLNENNNKTELIEDSDFREMCYGKYQFGPYKDMLGPLFEMYGAEYAGYEALYKYMDDVQIGAEVAKRDETNQTEGPIKVWERFSKGLHRIVSENKDGNVLLSTSSFAIAVVLQNLFPDFIQGGLVDNCSLTVLSYEDGKYKLEDFNNTNYRSIGEQHYKKDF